MKVTQSPKTKPNLKPLRIEWPWVQKNDDDSKIEARIAELVITHKAETELLKKSFEDQILSLIDKTKENKIHIESTVMDFNAKLATKSETRVLTATVIASEYVEHQTFLKSRLATLVATVTEKWADQLSRRKSMTS